MTTNRATQIENLNKSLKPPKELGGNFIPDGFKKQFDFMFVAEMPSMREPKSIQELHVNYNFKGDKRLNEIMAECGVGASYVTDIVKERGVPGRPTEKQIRKWLPFLLKEIDILKPKYIVVIGKNNYFYNFKLWVEPQIDKKIKADWIFHYSTQVPKKKFEVRFNKVISKLLQGPISQQIKSSMDRNRYHKP